MMEDRQLQKTILWVLTKTEDYKIREKVLGDEVEIAIGHPILKSEFDASLKRLVGERWVEKSFDDFNDAYYVITELGKDVAERTR